MELLVDTGAAISMVREDVWLRTKGTAELRELEHGSSGVIDASGGQMKVLGRGVLRVQLGGNNYSHVMLVARHLSVPCLLGVDFLRPHRIDILFSMEMIRLGNGSCINIKPCENSSTEKVNIVSLAETVVIPAGYEMVVPGTLRDIPSSPCLGVIEPHARLAEKYNILAARSLSFASLNIPVRVVNPGGTPITLYKGTALGVFEIYEEERTAPLIMSVDTGSKTPPASQLFDLRGIDSDERRQLIPLLDEFSDVFSQGSEDLGRTDLVYHEIATGDAAPVRQRPRRTPMHRRDEVKNMVDEMLHNDIIKPSFSPWSSPIVLVKKRDGSTRFCVDYRRLNDVTIKDAYPLPRIDRIFDTVAGAKYFSVLDLRSGYWQVEISPQDRQKTAFSTGDGLYEFQVLPFGVCNGPGTYQRLMDRVLLGLQWETCAVYLDDVMIWSPTLEGHLSRLREVFSRLREAHLKLNPTKCHILRREVLFLGHRISAAGIATDPSKISTVRDWPTPRNIEQLRSFLGLASYYRKYVRGFADIATPLHRLTRKGVKFEWSDRCNDAFTALRQRLITSPILSSVRPSGEFILDTDASNTGLGAVLSQMQDGEEKVIAYASCTLTKSERQYCVTRRELLAVVYGTKQFKHYLLGRAFVIRTDHNALRWLSSFKEPEGQVARWLERLSEYEFTIQHRPGKSHGNADGLSRKCQQCGLDDGEKSAVAQPQEAIAVLPIAVRDDTSSSWAPMMSMADISRLQDDDEYIAPVKRSFRTGIRPTREEMTGYGSKTMSLWAQWDRLAVKEDVLFRRWYVDGTPDRLQMVTPRDLREDILVALHDSPVGGHLGTSKTLGKLRERFYWPGMKEDVELWCRTCLGCGSRKAPTTHPRAPMVARRSGYPLHTVAVDLIGPLPRSNKGNRYIAVVTDYFTKWTEAYAMPDMEATTVAKTLVDEFICRFGAPTELHTDQGRQFESRLFKEMCALLGVFKTRTTPYHPQSDGLVERFNRTLGSMLSQFVNDHHTDWDERLAQVLMAYRSSVQETTRFTPYFLMFGRQVRLPVDIVYGRPEEEAVPVTEWAEKLRATLDEAHETVRNHQQQAQYQQKDHYDRKCAGESFSVGDLVWLHEPAVKRGLSKKLHRFWQGPYIVKQKLSDVTYRLQLVGSRRKRPVVHFNRLKNFQTRDVSYQRGG